MKTIIAPHVLSCNVLVTGTFNVLHAGHCELLEYASQFGKVTVGLNGDDYQRKKYGDNAMPLILRAYTVQSCRYVENVTFFHEDNPSELIKVLKPKVYVRGPDYRGLKLLEQEALDSINARLIICPGEKIANASALTIDLPRKLIRQQ